MKLTTISSDTADIAIYTLVGIGVVILIWMIIRDLLLKYRYQSALVLIQQEHLASVKKENTHEGIILLDPKLKLIGGNTIFYAYSGLAEIVPYKESINYLGEIFAKETRKNNVELLRKMIEVGSGAIELTSVDSEGSKHDILFHIICIRDPDKVIAYYLSMNYKYAEKYNSVDMRTIVQIIEQSQVEYDQFALLMIQVEGISALNVQVNEILKDTLYELQRMINNEVLHAGRIAEERFVMMIASDDVERDITEWTETVIEIIHYIVNQRTTEQYIIVHIGVAVHMQSDYSVEQTVRQAEQALKGIEKSGENDYHIFSH